MCCVTCYANATLCVNVVVRVCSEVGAFVIETSAKTGQNVGKPVQSCSCCVFFGKHVLAHAHVHPLVKQVRRGEQSDCLLR